MWNAYGTELQSRLLLGTANYPSLEHLLQAIEISGAEVITVSIKREVGGNKDNRFWKSIQKLEKKILPNTAGCKNSEDAVVIAELARKIFETNWIKLEVIGDDYTLQPNVIELIKAAKELMYRGFNVFPYCTEDLIVCQSLRDLGCEVLMPWAAPIGSGQGILNPFALQLLRNRLPEVALIVDAGIGRPSDATQALEFGFDGVLLNNAVANAKDPVTMALAFKEAVSAGRNAFQAGIIPKASFAKQSTSLIDTPFWRQP